jgi:TetR/AcrR family transcriptional repressor of mexJK operon
LEDPEAVAEQLLGMWQGLVVPGMVMGGLRRPGREERRRRVEEAVDAVLRAYAR